MRMPVDCPKGQTLRGWVALAMLVSLLAGCGRGSSEPALALDRAPARIVSLAPSVTDILFELNLGDRVVGVTRYCRPPRSAGHLADVGGYLDINVEAIVALEPDLVVLIQDHTATGIRLESLGLRTLQVDQGTIPGILRSIEDISATCRVPAAGLQLVGEIRGRLDRVRRLTSGLERRRALIVVGRDAGLGTIDSVWVAGRSTFYNDVLDLAGGTNAVQSTSVAYPEISREGLLYLDPDVVFDLLADLDDRHVAPEVALADWRDESGLRAVSEGRIYPVEESWAVVPGARIADLVEHCARLLHPEVRW